VDGAADRAAGLVGVVPTLLIFHQPFGFNAILGLIGLAGIIMRNGLILIGQIHTNEQDGLDPLPRRGRGDRPARPPGDPDRPRGGVLAFIGGTR
jgi:hypothetical protein